MSHYCDAIVVTCMDFRFQKNLEEWMHKHLRLDHYDRVSVAGAVFDFFPVLKQIDISNRLHGIKKVVLINHEDCGAYGAAGTLERHQNDLKNAAQQVMDLYPHLTVELYYAKLDGNVEVVS